MVSLAYAPARVIIECLKQVYKTVGDIEFEHLVLNNHYPIDEERNDKILKTVFDSYNCKYFDLGENVGLSAGYTYLINQANLDDKDIVIGVDLDVWPTTQGWGNALVKVLQDRSINTGWASLYSHHSPREFKERGYTEVTLGGIKCHQVRTAMLNSICAWTTPMLKDLGGIKEPNRFYGGFESMSYPIIKSKGYEWVFLPDYTEEYNDLVKPDPCYRHFKYEYAHKHSTKLDLKNWLIEDPERLNLK